MMKNDDRVNHQTNPQASRTERRQHLRYWLTITGAFITN